MAKSTRATLMLSRAGVRFTLHTYAYDPDAARIGLQAAQALGIDPARVLKTLIALVDGKPVCAVVPSHHEVSMKRLAVAFGGKSATMMAPLDAQRLTGYVIGGISPFGQKSQLPTAMEEQAFGPETVVVNGGQRGLQVELAPEDARRVLDARRAALVA